MVKPSNWEQIRALFHRALERPADERAAFVRAQSNDDVVVREVASLLAAHADVDAMLEAAGPLGVEATPARIGLARHAPTTLPAGTRLGPYTVVSPLGAGAMGEVYRARDTNLRRDIALKILPESLAADTDRLARFTREARTLGALNHPHIAQVHGFEEHGGMRALVMELVEGHDLAQLIARGPMRVTQALRIGRQIAEALEAAHARGIVHRDLKPANIMIREDGTVKVLDFGLAKAWTDDGASSIQATALGDTLATTTPPIATEVGVLVGTAAYMSPEQARGGVVEKGTDIWAFGCVLYEMLTGARAFQGAGVADTLVNVLQRDPAWDRLPADTPASIEVLLRRCLRKERRERLQDAAGVRIELDDVLREGDVKAQTVPPPARGLTSTVPWTMAAVFGRAGPTKANSGLRRWLVHALWAAAVLAAVVITFSVASRVGTPAGLPPANPVPVIVLMDSPLPGRVYDTRTRAEGGTNADDVTDALRDLRLALRKENTSAAWHREEQVVGENPDLIVTHLSCLLDERVGDGQPSVSDHLFDVAQNRLLIFLAYVAARNPRTHFIVYSRTVFQTHGGEEQWVATQTARLPVLRNRLNAFTVPGGAEGASFRDPRTRQLLRARIAQVLRRESR